VVEAPHSAPQGVTLLRVADTREALALCAAEFYGHPERAFRLTGVTGTNGKTSVTYFLEAIYNAAGRKTGVVGTVDTRIGKAHVDIAFATSTTPDPLELMQIFSQMRDAGVAEVMMEVTSHALALRKVEGLRFDTAIFTNLTQDHLDFHGTMEAYQEAKGKLFSLCDVGVLNADDPACPYFESHAAKFLRYGVDQGGRGLDVAARDLVFSAEGVEFVTRLRNGDINIQIPIPGRFTVYNALAAIGAALAAGLSPEVIQAGLASLAGVPGRIQRVPNPHGVCVIVDYAHTPDGLTNILTSAREFTPGRLITVFGCGGDRDRAKRPMMGEIAGRLSDYCVVTSDNPRTEEPENIIRDILPGVQQTACPYETVTDRKEAIEKAIQLARRGDCVVLAGKGHENYQIFKECTIHFDDSEVAAETLTRKSEHR
jgi:UDP-N-acetylmuramoyl-L-alanyl-D-glutamate--2,6-diaminopimelate ligase